MPFKKVAIFGSTGSIGINTLKVIDRHPDIFKVAALTAYNNQALLAAQVKTYRPKWVSVGDDVDRLEAIAQDPQVDIVVLAIRGAAALRPFLAAARAGKIIAPANKEALVVAGELLIAEAKRHGATIIPIDSEQSAIFQCLDGQQAPVHCVHLTASGGPLRDLPAAQFARLTVQDVLRHPRWKMGPKITVDSATLMNKGFEFIEAQRLFNLRWDQVKVVVHPEAIVHSMVEFADGSLLAQMGITDMRLPIQYALTYPRRLPTGLKRLDLADLGRLRFAQPDHKKFPALALAMDCARRGGSAPCVLNAADEVAVEAFLEGKVRFPAIYKVVEKVVTKHKIIKCPSMADINAADDWARRCARDAVGRLVAAKG